MVLHREDYFDHEYKDPDLDHKRRVLCGKVGTFKSSAAQFPKMLDHEKALQNAQMLVKKLKLDTNMLIRRSKSDSKKDSKEDYVLGTGLYDVKETVDIGPVRQYFV